MQSRLTTAIEMGLDYSILALQREGCLLARWPVLKSRDLTPSLWFKSEVCADFDLLRILAPALSVDLAVFGMITITLIACQLYTTCTLPLVRSFQARAHKSGLQIELLFISRLAQAFWSSWLFSWTLNLHTHSECLIHVACSSALMYTSNQYSRN